MSDAPPDIPGPILGASLAATVGELVAAWGSTHWLYAFIMMELVTGKTIEVVEPEKNPDAVLLSAVVIGMDARVQMGLLKTLSRKRIPSSDASRIAKLLDIAGNIKDMRDRIAHGFWEYDGKTMYLHMLKTVGRVRQTREPISPETVTALVIRLHKCTNQIVEIFKKHGFLARLEKHSGRYF